MWLKCSSEWGDQLTLEFEWEEKIERGTEWLEENSIGNAIEIWCNMKSLVGLLRVLRRFNARMHWFTLLLYYAFI